MYVLYVCIIYIYIYIYIYFFFQRYYHKGLQNEKVGGGGHVSQWNIGCFGSQMQNFRVGHAHFMLFVLISFALVTQREPSLQWNMGLNVIGTTPPPPKKKKKEITKTNN